MLELHTKARRTEIGLGLSEQMKDYFKTGMSNSEALALDSIVDELDASREPLTDAIDDLERTVNTKTFDILSLRDRILLTYQATWLSQVGRPDRMTKQEICKMIHQEFRDEISLKDLEQLAYAYHSWGGS